MRVAVTAAASILHDDGNAAGIQLIFFWRPDTGMISVIHSADRTPCRHADGVTPIILLNERLNAASDS
jgi:hypothetical protein